MPNRIKTWGTEILTSSDLNGEYNNIYEGTISRTGGVWGLNNNIPLALGTAGDAHLAWNTAQTTASPTLGLGVGNSFLVIRKGDMAYNFAFPSQTDPSLVVFSGSQNISRYISLRHNQTNAIINTGAGSLLLQVVGTTKATISATGLAVTGDLSTTTYKTAINGLLKGNGTDIVVATAGTDYAVPAVMVIAKLSANYTTTNNDVTMVFDTEVLDTNSWYDNTTGEVTIGTTGYYQIVFSLRYNYLEATMGNKYEILCRKDTGAGYATLTPIIWPGIIMAPFGGSTIAMQTAGPNSQVVPLNAGDKILFRVSRSGVDPTTYVIHADTGFSLIKVG